MFYLDDGNDSKRSLGIRDKQILYRNAKGQCENPGCKKRLDFDEMQVGHKIAWSRGGRTTLKNSVCLCYRCNKLQGKDSWVVFMKKQNVETTEMKAQTAKKQNKEKLAGLTVSELKLLAKKHRVTVNGSIEEGLFSSRRLAPTKKQYVDKLSVVVKSPSLRPKKATKPAQKKVTKSIRKTAIKKTVKPKTRAVKK